MTRTPSTSIVAVHAGTVKAASRRCAVAPQSGGASLDGPRAQSQGNMRPGRRNAVQPNKETRLSQNDRTDSYAVPAGPNYIIKAPDLGQPQNFLITA